MTLFADIMKIFSLVSVLAASLLVIYFFLKDIGIINVITAYIKEKIKSLESQSDESEVNNVVPLNNTVTPKKSSLTVKSKPKAKKQRYLNILQNENIRVLLVIIAVVLLSRVFLYLIGYMGNILLNSETKSFQSIWNKWDSPHYLSIAKDWYINAGSARTYGVFFPFYPILIKLFNILIGNYFISGIIISNISLIVACFYLYKLVKLEFGEEISFSSVKYMLIYPFSFFCGIVYTESLFLALTIMSFYFIRKRSWLAAGIFGAMAAFTRNFGLLLIVPAAIECIMDMDIVANIKRKRFKQIFLYSIKGMATIILTSIGSILYLCINKASFGNWFAFMEIQKENWHSELGFFAESIKEQILEMPLSDAPVHVSLWAPQITTFILVVALIFFAFKRVRISYIAYMLVYTIVCYSPTWLLSGPRYIMGLFPIFIILSLMARNKIVDNLITFVFSALLCFYTLAFALHCYIM